MGLQNLVGTPGAPADPAPWTPWPRPRCRRLRPRPPAPNPLIALNELLGSEAAGPLPPTAQRYRDAVLALMRALAAQGATPFLLVPRRFTVTGTEDWWRQVARSAGWCRRRTSRPRSSQRIGNLFLDQPRDPRPLPRMDLAPDRARHPGVAPRPDAGLPVGSHGRADLQPAAAWLQIVELQSQAGIVVARELALSTLWSWGWGTFISRTPSAAGPGREAGRGVHVPVGADPGSATPRRRPGAGHSRLRSDLTAGASISHPSCSAATTAAVQRPRS